METQAAVKQLKGGKAPGICGIHAELLKAGGNAELMSCSSVLCLENRHHPNLLEEGPCCPFLEREG